MNRLNHSKQTRQHNRMTSIAEPAVKSRTDVAAPTISDSAIVVNCANVKAALTRIQTSTGRRPDVRDSDFALRLLPVLEMLEKDGELKWSTLAKSLNERGVVTPAGKRWGPVTVSRLIGALGDVIRMSKWTTRR